MPYTTAYDDYWYCSWMCGFKNTSEKRVRNHENKKHGAATTRIVNEEVRPKGFTYRGVSSGKKYGSD